MWVCICISLPVFSSEVSTVPSLIVQTGHTNAINAVSFSPDGMLLATGSHDTSVKLWDIRTGLELRALTGHTNTITSLLFTHDGLTLVSGSLDGTIHFWDVRSGAMIRVLHQAASINCIALSPNGDTVAAAGWDHKVTLWNVPKGEQTGVLEGHSKSVNVVSFSPDGKLLATGSNDFSIKLWDAGSGALLRTITPDTVDQDVDLFKDIRTGK